MSDLCTKYLTVGDRILRYSIDFHPIELLVHKLDIDDVDD